MTAKKSGKRKAISPILATVILIAITLIAAVAIAGFVFGLFGTYMTSATVSVTSAVCVPASCSITLTNTGTATTLTAAGGIINFGGGSAALTCGAGTTLLGGGGSGTETCTFTGGTVGEAFTGSVGLANGGQAGFAGTFA